MKNHPDIIVLDQNQTITTEIKPGVCTTKVDTKQISKGLISGDEVTTPGITVPTETLTHTLCSNRLYVHSIGNIPVSDTQTFTSLVEVDPGIRNNIVSRANIPCCPASGQVNLVECVIDQELKVNRIPYIIDPFPKYYTSNIIDEKPCDITCSGETKNSSPAGLVGALQKAHHADIRKKIYSIFTEAGHKKTAKLQFHVGRVSEGKPVKKIGSVLLQKKYDTYCYPKPGANADHKPFIALSSKDITFSDNFDIEVETYPVITNITPKPPNIPNGFTCSSKGTGSVVRPKHKLFGSNGICTVTPRQEAEYTAHPSRGGGWLYVDCNGFPISLPDWSCIPTQVDIGPSEVEYRVNWGIPSYKLSSVTQVSNGSYRYNIDRSDPISISEIISDLVGTELGGLSSLTPRYKINQPLTFISSNGNLTETELMETLEQNGLITNIYASLDLGSLVDFAQQEVYIALHEAMRDIDGQKPYSCSDVCVSENDWEWVPVQITFD